MSKIGRRPVDLQGVKVELKGQEVHYAGKYAQGTHVVPEALQVTLEGDKLLVVAKENTRESRQVWGLHRALLSNKIKGAGALFEKQVLIVGLGYKAQAKGAAKLEFSIGLSHKVEVDLPKAVTVEIDKTGQVLTFKSFDKEVLGKVCGELRELKPTEPYKGTGIRLATDVIIRKAGKAKAAS